MECLPQANINLHTQLVKVVIYWATVVFVVSTLQHGYGSVKTAQPAVGFELLIYGDSKASAHNRFSTTTPGGVSTHLKQ